MKLKHTGHGHAHGKIILIGEHAVVYQRPALALPFQAVHVHVSVEPSAENWVNSALYQGPLASSPAHFEHLKTLVEALIEHFSLSPLRINFESNIPISAGMGSSAALASALTQAIYDGLDQDLSEAQRYEWTQVAERIAHGNPSGIDALSTTHDQVWWFVRGEGAQPLDAQLEGVLIVANSEIQGSTKNAVEGLAQRMDDNPILMQHIQALGDLALSAKSALQERRIDVLGQSLCAAHAHLKALGVSHPKLDAMVQSAMDAGAVGAKMTGGGLGGCMLALARNQEDAERIQRALKAHTYALWTHSFS
jgi:mevalonate kinase